MEALNKKIPSEQFLIQLFSQVSPIQIILMAVIYPTVLMTNIQLLPIEVLSMVSSVMIFLVSCRYLKSAFIITSITAIYATGIRGTTALFAISFGFYVLYRFLSKKNESLSLLMTANLAHFGDGLTTYIGLKRGLSESNIFLNQLIGLNGDLTIFLIKLVILPLTIYPYFRFPEEMKNIYLKTVLGIGLYLVFRNTLFILDG